MVTFRLFELNVRKGRRGIRKLESLFGILCIFDFVGEVIKEQPTANGGTQVEPGRSPINQAAIRLRRIQYIVNPQLTNPLSYTSDRYFVMQDPELPSFWKANK